MTELETDLDTKFDEILEKIKKNLGDFQLSPTLYEVFEASYNRGYLDGVADAGRKVSEHLS